MRRRFILAIAGVVAVALLVAGLGTFVLLTLQSRREARREVTDLSQRIAAEATPVAGAAQQIPALSRLQTFLKKTQRLTLVVVQANGNVSGPLPPGVKASDINSPALLTRQTESGFDGKVAYAATPFPVRTRLLAVVVTEGSAGSGGAGLYFLLSGGAALIIAFLVAGTLSRRITHPLDTVREAADRIARGDFQARVPMPTKAGSYEEVRSLSSSINEMAGNLERLRGQERQFLMSVSHDLRTPLTSIRGFAEALADGTTDDTVHAAGVIASEARRLERLVRDLLDLARLDAHRFGFDVRPIDLWEVVSDTAHGFMPSAENLGLTVSVHEPVGAPAPVTADPDRLAQVIANLMENACKYAERDIDVATWFRPGEAVITVDDDGPGIAPDDLPHVFERLWTNGRPGSRQVGSGLGLAIGAELVSAMGGTIRAESPVPDRQPPRGTRLIVSLPPRGTARSSPPSS
jgi:two-component system sensor histidine kinase BaeS